MRAIRQSFRTGLQTIVLRLALTLVSLFSESILLAAEQVSASSSRYTFSHRVIDLGGGRLRSNALDLDTSLGGFGGTQKSSDGRIVIELGRAGFLNADQLLNLAPSISSIINQSGDGGSTPVIQFSITDADGPASDLAITATSSNGTLIPATSVRLGGSGSDRTVQIFSAPGKTGTSVITLTVTDAIGGRTKTQFTVAVNVPGPRLDPQLAWATPASITYGTELGVAQLNATAAVPGAFVYTPAAGTVLSSGTVNLSVTFTPTDVDNYESVTRAASLVVNKAPLTIRADDKFKRESDALPALTATYTGLVNQDTPASLDTPVSLTTTATASSSIGSYPITASGASDANYIITHINGALTVTTRLAPAVTWAAPAPIQYGTALTSAQLNATADIPGSFSYNPPAGTVVGAGQGRILSVTFTPNDTLNYEPVTATVGLDILKVPLTIRADDKAKVYGAALPAFTSTVSGFVNGDTVAGLDTPVSFSTTATAASNAGTYPITPSGASDANYSITFEPGTLTVSKAALTIRADNKSKTYGAAVPTLTANYVGFVNQDTEASLDTPVIITTTGTASSAVGAFPITVTGAADANYTITFEPGSLTVVRATLTIRADDKIKTYGAALPALTASYIGLVNEDTPASLDTPATLSTTAAHSSGVGTYPITVSGATDANYAITFASGTLTVSKAELTIRANDVSKIYGAALPALTATYTGFVNQDSAASLDTPATLSTTATSASAAGNYPITVSGAAASNYSIQFVPGTLTITRALLTVRAEDKSKVYGATLPALTATYSGFVNQDTVAALDASVTLSTTASATSAVGSYPIVASGAFDGNYTIVFEPGTLTITRAPLLIRAEDKFMKQGESVPALTAVYTGFVNQDTPASLDTPVSLSTSADASTAVGTYPIIAAGASDASYTITHANGTLRITAKHVPEITWPIPAPITYGTALGSAQLNASANIPGSFSYQPASSSVLSAGQGQILSATFTPSDIENYETLTVVTTIDVLRAPLTVRAEDKSKVYGASLPLLTATYSGFIEGDTAESLDSPVSLSTIATAASEVGTYPVNASGADDANYSITFEPGALTITKAPLRIRADDKSKVYGAVVPTLTATYAGFVNQDSAATLDTPAILSTSGAATSDAGAYPITVTGASDVNYTISFEPGTLTVARAPLTIRAENKNKVYGAPLPAFTAVYEGLASHDTIESLDVSATFSTTATASSNVNSYPISVSGASDANYVIAFEPGTLTITRAPLTIRADDKAKPYGASLPSLTASYTGFVNQDTVASLDAPASLSTSASATSNAGTYPINVGSASDSNYTIRFEPGALTVTKAALTIRAADKSKLYGAALPQLTVTYTGFVNNDTAASLDIPVSLSTMATAASGVGAYPIVASAASDANYAIAFQAGTMTVSKAALTIRAEDKFKKQGEAVPRLTASYSGFVNQDGPDSLDTPVLLSTSATTTSPVGVYPITATGASDANYQITHLDGTLTVTAKFVPRVTWSTPAPITYGTPLGSSQLNAIADAPGSFVYNPAAGTVLPSGQGRLLSATFTPDDSITYEPVTVPVTLDVRPAPLTIRADDKTRKYGATAPEFTASYSGFVNGETASSLDNPVTFTTAAGMTSGVGTYPIQPSGASDSNYTIAFQPGTLAVTEATLTISPKNITRRFGASNPTLTGIIRGLKNNDPISAAYSTTATAESPLGVYPITATAVDPQQRLANYSLTIESATLTVQLETTFTGVAQDGYVAGALVFFDANKSGGLNANEPSTRTDSRGTFDLVVRVENFDSNSNGKLDPAEGTIVLTGGVDISTGLALQTQLTAPPGSTVVNPLTTLLTATVENNPSLTLEQSKAKLNQALGIPASVEITSFDPIAAASENDSRAKQVLSAGAKVQDTMVQISSLVGSTSAESKSQAASAVVQALAASVATGNAIDLDKPTVVLGLIENSSTLLGKTVNTQVKEGAAKIIAESNQVKTEVVASLGNALDAARELSRTQVTSQSVVAGVLEKVGTGAVTVSDAATQVSKDAMIEKVQASSVGDVLGVDERPGRFSFSQTAFQLPVGGSSALVTLKRSDGNFGEVTVHIQLKTTSGAVAATAPVVFGSRELTKSVDLLSHIVGSSQLAQRDVVPLTLSLPSNAPEETGLGETTSATLSVNFAPQIVRQPNHQSVAVGGTTSLTVTATGTPSPTYQWRKDGSSLSGQTSATLVIRNAALADSGSYQVVISNASGAVSSATVQVIVVAPPVIQAPPASQSLIAGSALRLEIRASGTGLSFEWRKDGNLIPNAVQSAFTRANAQESDSGEYTVAVRNLAGTVVSSGALVRVYQPASFDAHPVDQTIPLGAPAKFGVRVAGTGPFQFQWFKDGSRIQSATRDELALPAVQLADGGSYHVEVTSPFATAISARARLVVAAPPLIHRPPQGQTVRAGENVRYRVEASGAAPLTYQWFKDGVALPGQQSVELLLRSVSARDAGLYAVRVSNTFGTATSPGAELIVISTIAPSVVVQPQSQTVREGGTVAFEVVASGTEPLRFQWFKDGSVIAGAVSDRLELTKLRLSDAGEYTVAISNEAGGALSEPAVLVIRQKPAGDFDGDGNPDIVLQDQSGFLAVWFMRGSQLIKAQYLEPKITIDANWRIVASADWNNDRQDDLLFQHANGNLAVWFMRGNSLQSASLLIPFHPGDSKWRVVGAADFNKDSQPDLLFQHDDGTLALWSMKGIELINAVFLDPPHPGDGQWRVVAVGNFDSDEKPDLLFQHRNGTLAVWLMDKTQLVSGRLLNPSHPGSTQWSVVGAADWNQNGQTDLLFQNVTDGKMAMWFLNGTQLFEAGLLSPSTPGGTWKPMAPK